METSTRTGPRFEDPNYPLSEKEERFCQEYNTHLNATRAALSAGYKGKSVSATASGLLKKANVAARVKYLKEHLIETTGMTAKRIIDELTKMAFSSIHKYHNTWISLKEFEEISDDDKSCIQEIQTKSTYRMDGKERIEDRWVKLKLYDKTKSIEIMNNMLGHNAATKQEIKTSGQIIVQAPGQEPINFDNLTKQTPNE